MTSDVVGVVTVTLLSILGFIVLMLCAWIGAVAIVDRIKSGDAVARLEASMHEQISPGQISPGYPQYPDGQRG